MSHLDDKKAKNEPMVSTIPNVPPHIARDYQATKKLLQNSS